MRKLLVFSSSLGTAVGPSRGRRWALMASFGLLGIAAGATAAVAQPAARPSFKIEAGQLVLPSPVVFAGATAKLQPQSDATLRYVKDFLDDKPAITLLRIESHTDASGAPAVSQALSVERATAVARWLVSQGVDCKRLIAVGFGGTKPIADNGTEPGRALNRRTLFVMAALRERPIGGMPPDGGGQVTATNLCAK